MPQLVARLPEHYLAGPICHTGTHHMLLVGLVDLLLILLLSASDLAYFYISEYNSTSDFGWLSREVGG